MCIFKQNRYDTRNVKKKRRSNQLNVEKKTMKDNATYIICAESAKFLLSKAGIST